MKKENVGLLGEWKAARYLKKQGMRILKRRYRTAHGEIDLIAQDGGTVVFVEVKTRPDGRIGDGAAAVRKDKKSSICATPPGITWRRIRRNRCALT